MARRRQTARQTSTRSEFVELRRAGLRDTIEHEGKNYRWWVVRTRFLYYLASICIVGALLFTIYYLWKSYIFKSDWGSLETITVHSETVISKEEVIKLLNIPEKQNLFSINTEELENHLMACPAIRQARVSYRAASSPFLSVRVDARIPIAWVFCNSLNIMPEDYHAGLLIDGDACIFPCYRDMLHEYLKQNTLPIVQLAPPPSGKFELATEMPRLKPIVALLQLLKTPDIKRHVEGIISITAPNEWSLQVLFSNGTTAIFGIFDQERQVESLALALDQAQRDEKKIKLVNLIPRKNIPVVFE